jgi:hypothetical protein
VQHYAIGAPLASASAAVCGDHWYMSDSFVVACPYCGEEIELYLEPEICGELIQDCEVCCNPWLIRVRGEDEEREISVARADGSD